LNKIWSIEDVNDKLSKITEGLNESLFKELVYIGFVQKKEKANSKREIKELLNLESGVIYRSNTFLNIPKKVILAITKLAIKLKMSLLIIHTHPPKDYYTEECGAIEEVGFSEEDEKFNIEVSGILERQKGYSDPVYFLVLNNEFYNCIAYYHKKRYEVEIPTLSNYGLKRSNWRKENETEK